MSRYKDSSDDSVAEYYQAQRLRAEGAQEERLRILKLLKEQNVLRNCGATGKLVFVNCNTLEVLYLKDEVMEEALD